MDNLIKKIVEGTIDNMVFRDKPKKNTRKKNGKGFRPFKWFPY